MEEWWFDEELAGCRLGVGRSDRRLRQLVERMEVGFGESIPLACQEWAGTKAAYRFFSNERVSEEEILRGHFDATRHRLAASDGPTVASSPGRSGSRPAGSGLKRRRIDLLRVRLRRRCCPYSTYLCASRLR